MSRSRRPRCKAGRGCSACGDRSYFHQRRTGALAKADGFQVLKTPEAKDTDNYYGGEGLPSHARHNHKL